MAADPLPQDDGDPHPLWSPDADLTAPLPGPATSEKIALDGLIAAVTGASPRIGPALAVALARAGARVAVRTPASDQSEVSGVPRTKRALVRPTAPDATQGDQITDTADLSEQIDILVHVVDRLVFNAHYPSIHTRGLAERAERGLLEAIQLCQHIGRRMSSRNTGSLIIITPSPAIRPWPDITAGMMTTALIELARTLAREWADTGVRINAVTPGTRDTDPHAPAGSKPDAGTSPTQETSFDNLIGTVLWLASDRSGQVTGAHMALGRSQPIALGPSFASFRHKISNQR